MQYSGINHLAMVIGIGEGIINESLSDQIATIDDTRWQKS